MFLMRFTERAYVNYTEEDVRNSPNEAVRLTFSNSNFDPQEGHYLYNMYLDEYEYSEEMGFDGLMLNEHHNTPTCLGATMNLEAAILARNTKNTKIVLLGNPLPIFDNPIRLAEELAEIDMISGGRLVSGFVRGTGVESLATNTNPLHNRARFEEAHDLVIKTWTTPRPLPLGRRPLPLPRGQSLPGADAEAAPARLDPRHRQPRDPGVVRRAQLPVHLPGNRPPGHPGHEGHLRRGRPRARLRARSRRTSATWCASTFRTPTRRPTTWARATWWATSASAASRCPATTPRRWATAAAATTPLPAPARADPQRPLPRGRPGRSAVRLHPGLQAVDHRQSRHRGQPIARGAQLHAPRASWPCGPTTAPSATRTPCAAWNSWARKCCPPCARSAKNWNSPTPSRRRASSPG